MDLSEKLAQAQEAQAQIVETVKNLDAQINSKKKNILNIKESLKTLHH